MIWEKQLANIQDWENRTGETKQSTLNFKIIPMHGIPYSKDQVVFQTSLSASGARILVEHEVTRC